MARGHTLDVNGRNGGAVCLRGITYYFLCNHMGFLLSRGGLECIVY